MLTIYVLCLILSSLVAFTGESTFMILCCGFIKLVHSSFIRCCQPVTVCNVFFHCSVHRVFTLYCAVTFLCVIVNSLQAVKWFYKLQVVYSTLVSVPIPETGISATVIITA